jgi:hypothetical protein
MYLILKYHFNYLCQKTDQMDTPERITLYNDPITLYSISLQSYDEGLLDKPTYITLILLGLEIQPKH